MAIGHYERIILEMEDAEIMTGREATLFYKRALISYMQNKAFSGEIKYKKMNSA